jgi:hypothetical protein
VPDSRRAYAWHLMAMMVIRGAAACAVFKIDFAYAGPQSLRNAITRFDQVGLQEGWNLAKQVRDAIEELVTIFSGNPCRVDAQLETPRGAVALTEYASGQRPLL